MVMPAIIGLFAFVLLVVLVGVMFLGTILELIVNAVIIYLIGIRSLKEINKGWLKEYGIGIAVGLIIVWFTKLSIPWIWNFTEFLIIAFVAAQLVRKFKK